MSRIIYIGIDNGVSGSIGVMDDVGAGAEFHLVPVKEELNYQKDKKKITRLDFPRFVTFLEDLKLRYSGDVIVRAVLETPFVNPGNFVATATSLRCFEAEIIALEQVGISRQYVTSGDWQKKLLPGVKGRTELKKASRDVGTRMFPQFGDAIKKQKDADGLLITEYARSVKL